MTATKPTHPTEQEPEVKTGAYQATQAGLAFYIKRCKKSGVPLNGIPREMGFVLNELDKVLARVEALEAELASLKPKSKKGE